MCHGESWQKGEEEVDDLHDVDKDQEAASSLEGYEDLESVWQKRFFFFFRLMGKIWGRSFTIYRMYMGNILAQLLYMYMELSFLFRELYQLFADNPRSTA